MNHKPQCIPCFLHRVLRMSHLVTSDDWLHRKIVGEAMVDLTRLDDAATPAEVMHGIFKRTAKTLGKTDPYAEEKKRWTEEILANAETIRTRVTASGDPLLQTLKMSIIANEIDDELRQGLTLKGLLTKFDEVSFDCENLDEFVAAVSSARAFLFVHDAAAEMFFDRLLIERLLERGANGCQVTSVVRSQQVLGDATRADAEEVGLGEIASVIDPGLDCLGLPIEECSNDFRAVFRSSDLVIAKGQACYQSLEGQGRTPDGEEKDVWFLFRVKCPVMAKQLAVGIGDLMLEPN